jgi:hypothetical protein
VLAASIIRAIALRNIPEDIHLHIRRRENPESHLLPQFLLPTQNLVEIYG